MDSLFSKTTKDNTAIGITVHESGQNTVYGFWDGFHTFLKHYAQYNAMDMWHLMDTFPATGLLLVEQQLTRDDCSTGRKTCPSVILSTNSPAGTNLGMNSSLRDRKPGTKGLRYVTNTEICRKH